MQAHLLVQAASRLAGRRRPGLGLGRPHLVQELLLLLRDRVPRLRLDLPGGGDGREPGLFPRGITPRIARLSVRPNAGQAKEQEIVADVPTIFLPYYGILKKQQI